ncbi:MAG: tetratricopeptide repeat protein, partial [Parasphingopyxis sp.]
LQDEQGRAFRHARERLAAGRDLPGEIVTPAQGVAELLARLAADIGRRDAQSLALTLSRYAGFVAPDNPIAWLLAANMLVQDGQYAAALAALDRVSPESPYFAEAQDMRVGALLAQGERERALALVREHTEERRADVSDWLRFGGLYTELDRHEEAVDAYRRALRLEREGDEGEALWTTWLLYGGALLDAGRWEESREALDQALGLAPDEPVLLNFLGYALLERREQLDRAEELIRRASEMRPDNPAITDSLGWVLFVRGKYDEAIPTLERAVVADPDEPTINEHLGDAYWAVGRRRDARFAWQAALVTAEDEAAERIAEKLDFGLTPETASP